MSYSIEASSDGCYEGTTCLINKLNIRDEELLKKTESAITLAKISYLNLNPLPGAYDFAHYRARMGGRASRGEPFQEGNGFYGGRPY